MRKREAILAAVAIVTLASLGCGSGLYAPCGGSAEERKTSCWKSGYSDATAGRAADAPFSCRRGDERDLYTLGYCEGSGE